MIHFNFVFSFDFCFLHLLDVEILQESCQEVQDFNLQEKLDDSGRANKAGVVSVFVHHSWSNSEHFPWDLFNTFVSCNCFQDLVDQSSLGKNYFHIFEKYLDLLLCLSRVSWVQWLPRKGFSRRKESKTYISRY